MASLGVVLALRRDRAEVNARVRGQFVCPMHVEVTSDAAGECPICGMALVRSGISGRDSAQVAGEDAVADDTIAAAQLLSRAASGVAPNLIGYYPSPLRQHVLRYEVFAPAWVETDMSLSAVVYRDQLPSLEPRERALFSPTADPATEVEVQLGPGTPETWDRSMSLIHFALGAAQPALKPGTVGWVKFAPRPRPMQVIPAGAVLQAPEGPYVLVVSSGLGTATKRPIEIGRIFTGLGAVLSGLELREMVVSVNAFFWDAERRLRSERRLAGGGER